MQNIEFEQLYKIDKSRLINYYDRIKKNNLNQPKIQIVAKFLINQSIGSSYEYVLKILSYYENKIIEGKEILDLAFEWIRCQKIRLEYKKYLIRAQYPNNNLSLAVDDCIFHFFLEYDNHLRLLLKDDIYEHEIASLTEIFFVPYQTSDINIAKSIKMNEERVSTILERDLRVNTKIITLRAALSQIIVHDYERVLFSRLEEEKIKSQSVTKRISKKEEAIYQFRGSLLERIIKTYCINKTEIRTKAVESAVNDFLISYFRFGKFYDYEDFKDLLAINLAENLNSGLTEKYKNLNPVHAIESLIQDALVQFRVINKIKTLDGSAWINDLKPVLKKFVIHFADNLFESNQSEISKEPVTVDDKKDSPKKVEIISKDDSHGNIDFSAIFELDLEVESYRDKLEKLLENSNLSSIEKRNVIRKKVQEFKMLKRKSLHI